MCDICVATSSCRLSLFDLTLYFFFFFSSRRRHTRFDCDWSSDVCSSDLFSDVVTPLPAQPDTGIVGCYAGDYDYGSAILTKHLTSWVDGRVAISGQSQQDAFTDREAIGFAVTTTNPACGSFFVGAAPVQFVVNLSDA